MDTNTLRVLSIDGGGVRGYFSVVFLQNFIKLWGIKGTDLWKYFDVICGSSIGGIQALAYSFGLGPDDLESLFTDESPWIFTIRGTTDVALLSCNASSPNNRPNTLQKITILGNNDYFYSSVQNPGPGIVCATNNYGSSRLKSVLQTKFGTQTLQDLKTHTLVTAFDRTNKRPVFFSNYNSPAFIGQDFLLSDVGMTTAAAPVMYFAPYYINEIEYIDGGTTQNNPSNIGLTLAKMIKPLANRFCVLSVGTGRGELGFDDLDSNAIKDVPFQNAVEEAVELIGVSMAGSAETVGRALDLEARFSPFSNLFHYRFNTVVDPTQTALDDASASSIAYLKNLAQDTFAQEEQKIATFLGHLIA